MKKFLERLENLIAFIRSDNGTALGTLFVLAVMVYHTAIAFYVESNGGWVNGIFGSLFAIGIDFAVLIFVLRGNSMAYVFSIFQIVMNMIHFGEIQQVPFYYVSFGAYFISFSLPLIIAAYSHEVNKGLKIKSSEGKREIEEFSAVKETVQNNFEYLCDELTTIKTHSEEIHNETLKAITEVKEKVEASDTSTEIEFLKQELEPLKEAVDKSGKFAQAAVETLRNFKNASSEGREYYHEII